MPCRNFLKEVAQIDMIYFIMTSSATEGIDKSNITTDKGSFEAEIHAQWETDSFSNMLTLLINIYSQSF